MNELLKIERHEGKETVNARDLHKFLEVGKDFSTWFKDRCEKYGFIGGVDYITDVVPNSGEKGGRPAIEYFITLSMGKEISMVENNAKGKEARLYFIEVENKAREQYSGHSLIALAVIEAQKLLDIQAQLIQTMKPKAEFYDQVTGSKDTIDIGVVAKLLNVPGYGRNRLFERLREEGVLMSDNQPYQKYVDRGYFRIIQSKFTKPDGSTHVGFKTVVFQTGVNFIRKIITEIPLG